MIKLLKTDKNRGMIFSIIFLILISASKPTNMSTNDENWQDTFDNSDSLNKWTVENGNVTVDTSKGIAVASNCKEINGFCLTSLWRNSTATSGTWSFDIHISENHSFFMVYFIGVSVYTTHPEKGYMVHINKNKIVNLWFRHDNYNDGKLDTYTPDTEDLNTWMHFDVIRNSNGYMDVFLNNKKIMTGQDNVITESENINFQLDDGAKLDNVSYIQSTSPISKTKTANADVLLAFLAIIPIIIIYRKKKRY